MAESDAEQAATYELPPGPGAPTPPTGQGGQDKLSLPPEMLVQNVRWFCRLRWLVIATLTLFGLVGLNHTLTEYLGFWHGVAWPFVTAGLLVVTNTVFLLHARRLRASPSASSALLSLWAQIISDLLVLTVVVHYMGSLTTFIPFAYLFHIVLTCIFLTRRQSLAVTMLAIVAYAGCVTAERTLFRPSGGLFRAHLHWSPSLPSPPTALMNFVSMVGILLIVWYLASRLAGMVRDRDAELAQTNRRLVAAQQERSQHMLRTTHELKAPFAAIHANAQLLLRGYCGDLPDPATEVVSRIAARCKRLAQEIQEMLQLANLQSAGQRPAQPVRVDLAEVLEWSLAQVRPRAQERGITIQTHLGSAPVTAVEDHMKMLLINLVSNAVSYSRQGGQVRVTCRPGPNGQHEITISDEGIGIAPQKLPKIFDQYYRTNEAVQHNPESTGLGLAIVRTVAQANGIGVSVTSRQGHGTTFVLRFPRRT